MSEQPPDSVQPTVRHTPGADAAKQESENGALPVGDTTPHRVDGFTDTTKLPPVPDDRGTVHGELQEPVDSYRATGHPQPGWSHTPPRGVSAPEPTAVGGFQPVPGGGPHSQPQQHSQQSQPQQFQQPQRFHQPQRPPARRPSRPVAGTKAAEDRTRAIVLKGLGLVAIAVVSGLIWFAIRYDGGSGDGGGGTINDTGKYDFAQAHEPVRDSNCAEHAYDRIQLILRKFKCKGMVRTLYTTQPDGARTAVSSVSVIKMPSVRTAKYLRKRTTQEGTGNVTDLPKDGVTVPGAPSSLAGGGYASKVSGSTVVIVESDFLRADQGEDRKADVKLLESVSRDALRLGSAAS